MHTILTPLCIDYLNKFIMHNFNIIYNCNSLIVVKSMGFIFINYCGIFRELMKFIIIRYNNNNILKFVIITCDNNNINNIIKIYNRSNF